MKINTISEKKILLPLQGVGGLVKGHGGSIQINSIEGEGSEFIVTLPVN